MGLFWALALYTLSKPYSREGPFMAVRADTGETSTLSFPLQSGRHLWESFWVAMSQSAKPVFKFEQVLDASWIFWKEMISRSGLNILGSSSSRFSFLSFSFKFLIYFTYYHSSLLLSFLQFPSPTSFLPHPRPLLRKKGLGLPMGSQQTQESQVEAEPSSFLLCQGWARKASHHHSEWVPKSQLQSLVVVGTDGS